MTNFVPTMPLKKIIGYCLFGLSFTKWAWIFLLPTIFKMTLTQITISTTLITVVCEGIFIVSLFILGKDFYQSIKSRFANKFNLRKKNKNRLD